MISHSLQKQVQIDKHATYIFYKGVYLIRSLSSVVTTDHITFYYT